MKTINLFIVLVLWSTVSCRPKDNVVAQKIDFGIYEMSDTSVSRSFDPLNMSKTIGLEQIRKTKVEGTDVIIYFNIDGAEKWGEMTKRNIGKTIAFVIDGKIISTPIVVEEIREGVAKISGITDESRAKIISESLNAGTKR